MKNHWLEQHRLRLPSNDDLTEAIVIVQRKEWDVAYVLANQRLAMMLFGLTDNIIRFSGLKLIEKITPKIIDKDDLVQEIVCTVYEKLGRFDPDKGKAFNWCTTVILGLLRQLVTFSHTGKYPELKRKYAEHMARRKADEASLPAGV